MINLYTLDFLPYPFLCAWFADYSGRRKFFKSDLLFSAVLSYFIIFAYIFPVFLVLLLVTRALWNKKKQVRFLPALGLFILGSYAYFSAMDYYVESYYLIIWYVIVFFYQLFFAALILYVSLHTSETDVAERL